MIGTEAQFSTKRCTPALTQLVAQAINFESLNAVMARENVSLGLNCIGSRCAQWCWFDYANDAGQTHFVNEAAARDFTKGRRDPTPQGYRFATPARGYCGLTGTRE